MKDEELYIHFESCKLSFEQFNHPLHVRMAWIYLRKQSLPEAIIAFRDALKKFIKHHSREGVYHETITFIFLLIIHDRMKRKEQGKSSWELFAQENQDLLVDGKKLLYSYYSKEAINSPLAKKHFLLPDGFIH